MKRYLAINIGPIAKTFSMARKPREFWAASFLFSYLMEFILEKLSQSDTLTMISPYYEKSKGIGVGLFPDRSFFVVNSRLDIQNFLDEIIVQYAAAVQLPAHVVKHYINVMVACEYFESPSAAIKGLNRILDYMELNQYTSDSQDYSYLYNYIRNTIGGQRHPLFQLAFENGVFPINTLAEIALCDSEELKYSYQKYVCIVQADGDAMGSIVQAKDMEGKLVCFSKRLMDFGKEACEKIQNFGGIPVYAGGDDLLFIAPVRGRDNNSIIDLIDSLDSSFAKINTYLKENGINTPTSMSYGVSIIYHKYPLYEAWRTAASMLFLKAKKVTNKNAIAINLRKNSGSDLEFRVNKKTELYSYFRELIAKTPKESIVSSVAHKVRANDVLLDTFSSNLEIFHKRLTSFFDKIIDVEAKTEQEKDYLTLTMKILERVYRDILSGTFDSDTGMDDLMKDDREIKNINHIISLFYSILRIAKFIKGEDIKNE